MREIVVSVSVSTASHEQATKAAEVLARAATGLVLDGIEVLVSLYTRDSEQ